MLRQLLNNKKAQNTAEYALLIALVVAAIVAMQTFAQRALQAKMHDAAEYMVNQTSEIGNKTQYETKEKQSNYDVESNSEDKKALDTGTTYAESNSNRVRAANGFEQTVYNNDIEDTK